MCFNFDPSALPYLPYQPDVVLSPLAGRGVLPQIRRGPEFFNTISLYGLPSAPLPTPLSLSQSTMASNDGDSNDGTKPEITMKFSEHDKSFDVYVQRPGDSRPPLKVPRTTKEIEQFFPYQPPKPKAPGPLPLDLFNKAVEDPGSLTEKERLEILDWVPEAEADERCRNVCGMTWQELITTAVEKPENLTSDDISLIRAGRSTTYKIRGAEHKRDFRMLMRHPEDVRNLW